MPAYWQKEHTMLWFAYVIQRGKLGFDLVKHTLYVPNSTRDDGKAISLRVAQTYQADPHQVLVIPAPEKTGMRAVCLELE
jgi:hypothetical protein